MKMIVGLGNPGDKYAGSRHNMGFRVIDILAERHGIRVNTGKQRGLMGSGVIGGQKVLLVKPLTYMNNSGECVRPAADYYKLAPEDILVIYDDIALPVGQLRLRKAGSAGGHNGMKSLIAHLGSQDFPRVRVGVGAKPSQMDLADYVLGHFPADELKTVRESLESAADAVESILADGVDIAMNKYNIKPSGPKEQKKKETEE
ncbi:MAG: aminoacyl-tRNA hydrolase [Lachnospiraceae bacterium]|nr:aminoacyl-tRNA hydrolase [Lachnospiraceae bacterium]